MSNSEKTASIEVRPVGFVRDPRGAARDKSGQAISEIVINPELAECLDGVEDYSHLQVIYWLHGVPQEQRHTQKQLPCHAKEGHPQVGVFALRCPGRPNPIGLAAVELVGREGNVVRVRGLDASDGSPILDIKPYSLRNDHPENPRVSWYALELWDRVHHGET